MSLELDIDIDETVALTIAHTNRLIESGEVSMETAIFGLSKVISDLSEKFPERSDLFLTRLAEWRRRHTN